jgi:translation elongation factor EF-1beta
VELVIPLQHLQHKDLQVVRVALLTTVEPVAVGLQALVLIVQMQALEEVLVVAVQQTLTQDHL